MSHIWNQSMFHAPLSYAVSNRPLNEKPCHKIHKYDFLTLHVFSLHALEVSSCLQSSFHTCHTQIFFQFLHELLKYVFSNTILNSKFHHKFHILYFGLHESCECFVCVFEGHYRKLKMSCHTCHMEILCHLYQHDFQSVSS